jgi:aminomethyltransferase
MSMLKRTPLFEEHKRLGAKMIDFGGWELPVQYSGLSQEHMAVRSACGIFDVSHMGELRIRGPGSAEFLNFVTTNDCTSLSVLQAQYSALCNDHGGVIDDLVVYRMGQDEFFLVVNAANVEKDHSHLLRALERFKGVRPSLTNESDRYAQIAVQGPRSTDVLRTLTSTNLDQIKTYWFAEGMICEENAIIARTGYTGEDGFELYLTPEAAPKVWRGLIEAGGPLGLVPCGLGARDTLRLEMKYALYGHELDEETNPLEVGLAWITKLNKEGGFIGKDAVLKMKSAGIPRSLVGIKSLGRGIPRQGYPVFDETGKRQIGRITSGTQSPTLQKPIGVALIEKGHESPGSRLLVRIREDFHEFEVCKTPFVEIKKEKI